jgi:hypothetical protein
MMKRLKLTLIETRSTFISLVYLVGRRVLALRNMISTRRDIQDVSMRSVDDFVSW